MAATTPPNAGSDMSAKHSPNSEAGKVADRQRNWWLDKIPDDVAWPATKELLVKYSGIPEEEVEEHVYRIRQRAWAICDYPCIGTFRFLDLSIGQAPHYDEILARLKQGQRMLDIGCCFGQDERRLVSDGAPSTNLYACDLRADFFALGHELFRDIDRPPAHFFAADVFDTSNPHLLSLDSTVDIINASAFFHLFDYEGQLQAATRVARLLRKTPGSLVVGRQMGNKTKGGLFPNRVPGRPEKYRHDERTWEGLWREVGERTGTRWEVKVWWMERTRDLGDREWNEEGARSMKYSCRMV